MIESVIETFCKERGITLAEFENPKRKSNVWITRYMIWHCLHYNYGMSASKLSGRFNRNVPSIFRGIRIIKHQFKYHKKLCNEYHDIVAKLEGASSSDAPSGNME